jgi:hypothetical protein
MIRVLLFLSLGCLQLPDLMSQIPEKLVLPFERNPNHTLTYDELIAFCKIMDNQFEEFRLDSIGITDVGVPLHFVVISESKVYNKTDALRQHKAVLLINNGIHPGEPEGIDATMALARDILMDENRKKILENLVIVIIPVLNTGGMLNRNTHSRVNQNGPESYGFRGNARNLDLNRDFIKMDSQNAKAFSTLYHLWHPHIFLDNHTSNGADYQHTMTLLQSLPDKLGGVMSEFANQQLIPDLYESMDKVGWPMCPYVVTRGQDPVSGIYAFNDSPRYSSGYAAIWGSIALLTETHMLKPFIDRLHSTYTFMDLLITQTALHAKLLIQMQDIQTQIYMGSESYSYNWKIDTERVDSFLFLGYEREEMISGVSGKPIFKYNQSKSYSKNIPYYNRANPQKTTVVPLAYIIPQAWGEVIERMDLNDIYMYRLEKDTFIEVQAYKIMHYQTIGHPYEGHYLHYDIVVETSNQKKYFRKGDYVVPTAQKGVRYIIETLEPDAEDSFFAWNFFDSVLMAKEGFSDYVFDDLAEQILNSDDGLKQKFIQKKKNDPLFDKDAKAQLQYIYDLSAYKDQSRNQYPVYKLLH